MVAVATQSTCIFSSFRGSVVGLVALSLLGGACAHSERADAPATRPPPASVASGPSGTLPGDHADTGAPKAVAEDERQAPTESTPLPAAPPPLPMAEAPAAEKRKHD